MSNTQPEPSMEEILASIRRIISEDEEEPAQKPTPRAEPVRASAPEPVRPVAPPRPAISFPPQPEPRFATEDVEMIRKNVSEEMQDHDDGLIAERTVEAASKAFLSLSQSVQVSDGRGRTLEDMVEEMIRPMIKDWLDANLATLVEEKVEEEVQRVARRRR
jgi:cell pole-organizing protein PopZ